LILGTACSQPALQAQDTLCRPFAVDARSLPPGTQVGLRGSIPPLSWDKTYPLTDTDQDGIFEGTVCFLPKSRADVLEYKFVYGTATITYELPEGNRIWVLSDSLFTRQEKWDVATVLDTLALPYLTTDQVLEDLNLLKNCLTTLHPGIYRYQSPQQVADAFEAAKASVTTPVSLRKAFLLFSQLTAVVQCGHTFPNYINQSGLVKQAIFQQPDKLPFCFALSDGRMIVTAANPITGLKAGDEIISIQGENVPALADRLLKLVKGDGGNRNKRLYDLQIFPGKGVQATDVYLPLLSPPKTGEYMLEVMPFGGQKGVRLQVKAISAKERYNSLTPAARSADSLWQFRFLPNNTAYLRLGTFDGFQLDFDWRSYLLKTFETIKQGKVSHLVVDIRGNEGGQDDVLLLLGQLLTRKPITTIERVTLTRFQKVPDSLRPYLFTWDKSFFDLTPKTIVHNNGFFRLKTSPIPKIKPDKRAFEGKVYLLTDAGNSSATFYLAELAKVNQIATLAGEPTGGSQKGLNAGGIFFLRLPNTGIEVDIPIFGSFSPEKPPFGIVPDVVVKPGITDLMQGKDAVLQQVLKLIEETK